MTDDLYSGSIDWDRIYSTFHAPLQVTLRIHEELGEATGPVLFSGFPETASHLADLRPVIFVDVSSAITAQAKKRYPNLKEVHTGDVTQVIASIAVPIVAITCRISVPR